MVQLRGLVRDSINPLGYGVTKGFNCTTSFKYGLWGKSSISKDIFKLIYGMEH